MPAITCPRCRGQLQLDPQFAGWQVRCPQCGNEFTAGPPAPGHAPPWPAPRPSVDVVAAGLDAVRAPAVALLVTALAHMALAVLGGVALVLIGLDEMPRDEDAVVAVVIGTCLAVFGVPYFGLMAYGAVRMKRLDSHGWAMTSAIMAVAAFQVAGFCAVLAMGIGVWALIALSNHDVKAGFQARAG